MHHWKAGCRHAIGLCTLAILITTILGAAVSLQSETGHRAGLDALISDAIQMASGPQAANPGPEPSPVPLCLQPPSAAGLAGGGTALSASVCDPNRLPDLEALWIGGTPWMGGNPISGGEVWFGSIGKEMSNQVESNLTTPDYVPVEIHFDSAETTFCQTFRLETNYAPAGVGVFRGSAWDVSNPSSPRRLNLCFTEWNDGAGPNPPPNLLWDPDTTRNSPRFGKFEFLFIMLSDYDGTGLTYAGINPGTTDQDMLYFWYPRLEPGHAYFEALPATLRINIFRDYITDKVADADDRTLSLSWLYCGAGLNDGFRIMRGTTSTLLDSVAYVIAGQSSYVDTGLTNGTPYYYQVQIFGPNDSLMGQSSVFSGTPEKRFDNMSLLSQWVYPGGPWNYGGIWGHVHPTTGREYALVCVREGLVAVVDIDSPTPNLVAELWGFGDTKEVKTYRNYVLLDSEFGPVNIYDLSALSTNYNYPPLVGVAHPDGEGSHCILVDDHYLYTAGNHGIGGLEIFDIINPANPVKVGAFEPFYYHDLTMRNDTLYAYGIYGNGIDILDVSNKSQPSLIARFNYPGSGPHNGELSFNGKHLFIGDEIGTGQWTRVFDVSDPTDVSFVTDMIVDANTTVHNCYRRGDILYIGHYGRGVRAWNVADPANPFEAGFYDTEPSNGPGVWTAYPMPSGRIVASDMSRGLFVLQFDGIETPSCICTCHGNPNCDSDTTLVDVVLIIDAAFRGGLTSPGPGMNCGTQTTDVDCNGQTDIVDVVRMTNVAFRGAVAVWEFCKPCYP